MSFIVTVALIGSMTAAITDWRIQRQRRPLLDRQITNLLNNAVSIMGNYLAALNEAREAAPPTCFLVGNETVSPYRYYDPHFLLLLLGEMQEQYRAFEAGRSQ